MFQPLSATATIDARERMPRLRLVDDRPTDPHIIARVREWVEALESGEFGQVKRALYHPASNKACCLGVLCLKDPTLTQSLKTTTWQSPITGEEEGVDLMAFNENTGVLPVSLFRELGFSTQTVDVYDTADPDVVYASLADLNDAGLTFREIALIIRRSWLS